jgi:phosphatidylserine/phosphatidylglycerophosphate/cardiolipin synthase-like enzyme
MDRDPNVAFVPQQGGPTVLLRDAAYREFVLRLFDTAQERIWVAMFYFRYDGSSYPTEPLVRALRAAVDRQVDVRVLLDTQIEGDIRAPREINVAAYEALKASGVNARFDDPKTLQHSKVVIVDSNHTVVGSHNWTAGSTYVYRDVSLYMESTDLAAWYENRFSSLWASATAPP